MPSYEAIISYFVLEILRNLKNRNYRVISKICLNKIKGNSLCSTTSSSNWNAKQPISNTNPLAIYFNRFFDKRYQLGRVYPIKRKIAGNFLIYNPFFLAMRDRIIQAWSFSKYQSESTKAPVLPSIEEDEDDRYSLNAEGS